MNQDTVNKSVLVLMVIAISTLFLSMIQQFVMAIFLAGLFSAMARPVYRHLKFWLGGRRHLASLTTMLLMIVVVLIPLLLLIGIVVSQAIDVGQSVTPWVRQFIDRPDSLTDYLQHLPFYEQLVPYHEIILGKAGQLVGTLSKLIANGLSSATLGTANFLFMTFVFLYTLYFFQMDGPKLIRKILYYLPLDSEDENLMLEKFTSVTRATLKGSLLVGLLQGGLAGIAFAIAGIDNAVFWGTVMAVLSIIPSVGSALVWAPACAILIMQGNVVAGTGLLIFCALVVGSLDNVLRPILVGKDTRMHELMIFFGTLGGIVMFGIAGIFIGPVIASLFVTIWELYGIAFDDFLPEVYYRKRTDKAVEEEAAETE
ncbi:MAG: AI-2E family transporter [Gammaproteobacteria bacterium]|nr:AI-2E family transporter [Gammaproteobacteria bacterium]MDH3534919.1 AI-2E family transporter [Gammaproteobacteria bacterium]